MFAICLFFFRSFLCSFQHTMFSISKTVFSSEVTMKYHFHSIVSIPILRAMVFLNSMESILSLCMCVSFYFCCFCFLFLFFFILFCFHLNFIEIKSICLFFIKTMTLTALLSLPDLIHSLALYFMSVFQSNEKSSFSTTFHL